METPIVILLWSLLAIALGVGLTALIVGSIAYDRANTVKTEVVTPEFDSQAMTVHIEARLNTDPTRAINVKYKIPFDSVQSHVFQATEVLSNREVTVDLMGQNTHGVFYSVSSLPNQGHYVTNHTIQVDKRYYLQTIGDSPCLLTSSNTYVEYWRASTIYGCLWNYNVEIFARNNTGYCMFTIGETVHFGNINAATTIQYRKAGDNTATSLTTSDSGTLSGITSAINQGFLVGAEVDSEPAFVFSETGAVGIYMSRLTGTTWPTTVTTITSGTNMYVANGLDVFVIDGRPCVAFGNNANDLIFVRASNSTGSSWDTPITVDSANTLNGTQVRLTTILRSDVEVPIIFYTITTGGNNQLRYILATNAQGTAWDTTSYTVDDDVHVHTSGTAFDVSQVPGTNGKVGVTYIQGTEQWYSLIDGNLLNNPSRAHLDINRAHGACFALGIIGDHIGTLFTVSNVLYYLGTEAMNPEFQPHVRIQQIATGVTGSSTITTPESYPYNLDDLIKL